MWLCCVTKCHLLHTQKPVQGFCIDLSQESFASSWINSPSSAMAQIPSSSQTSKSRCTILVIIRCCCCCFRKKNTNFGLIRLARFANCASTCFRHVARSLNDKQVIFRSSNELYLYEIRATIGSNGRFINDDSELVVINKQREKRKFLRKSR